MQNDFITGPLGTTEAVTAYRNAVDEVRSFVGDVYYTLDTHGDGYLDTQEGRLLPVPHCIKGTSGWMVPRDLGDVLDEKRAVAFEKPTFGSVELAEHLRERRPDSITLIGLCTDICVVTNALLLKAFLPDVPMRVVAGCCAGTTPRRHREALDTMRSCQVSIV